MVILLLYLGILSLYLFLGILSLLRSVFKISLSISTVCVLSLGLLSLFLSLAILSLFYLLDLSLLTSALTRDKTESSEHSFSC